MGLALDLTDSVGSIGDYQIYGFNEMFKREREDKPMKKNLKEKMNEEMHQLTCVMNELQELQESDAYAYLSEEDKELVSAQLNAMSTYFNILNTRYRRLKGDYK